MPKPELHAAYYFILLFAVLWWLLTTFTRVTLTLKNPNKVRSSLFTTDMVYLIKNYIECK